MSTITRHTGRPFRSETPIPPKVQKALTLRAAGHTWRQASEEAGISKSALQQWKDDPRAISYVDRLVKESLSVAHSKLMSAAPQVADELLRVATDPSEKGYVRVNACEAVFRVIQQGVLDTEMRAQLCSIRQQLAALEQGQVIDV